MAVDSGAWTSRANVKEHLNIATAVTKWDALIDNLINASYKILEEYIGHVGKSATYTEYYDGDGTNTIILRQYPVISITSVHDDVERDFLAATLIDATDYVFDAKEGALRLFQNTTSFVSGIQNVKVVYVAGYATIPADMERASILHVAHMFKRAGTEGTTSQVLGGKSETYDSTSLPEIVRSILRPHKSFAV